MSLPAATIVRNPPATKRFGRTATVVTALVLIAALVWHVNATIASHFDRWTLPDLQVYRAAVGAAFCGQPVYTTGFTTSNLPWLYPPFALIALAPFAWLPADAAKVTISLLSIAALAYCCHASWRATTTDRTWALPLTLATTAVLLVSEPMQGNLMMGQINVLVAALVLTDVLLPTGHRLKGLGVGLATGMKLTPALVGVYYLLRRDWPAARRAAMAFTASVFLGALSFPGLSWTYWTQAVLTTRIGPAHLGNQSLLGVLLRIGALSGVDEGAVRAGWLLLAVALCLGAIVVLVRFNPDPLGTYCGLAAITLLVSPLSWTPHWISLAAPMTIWIASRRPRIGRIVRALVVAGLLLFAWPVDGGLVWLVYPANYWPDAPPLVRAVGRVVFGSLYAGLGTAALAMILAFSLRLRVRPAQQRAGYRRNDL